MYAIAEFGSRCRNTSDSYSDRDLLIICPTHKRRRLHKKYSSRGYSVTLLSEDQLLYMQARGSLFLQHLKNEATILIDSGSKLRSFLDQCQLICPTVTEILKCESTLKFIASWPDCLELSAWKADFLFCVSRDYLIKKLAVKQRVAFGLEDIERQAKDLYHVKKEDFIHLYSLRKAKAAYRGGAELPKEHIAITIHWLALLRHWFGIELPSNWPRSKEIDVSRMEERRFNSAYERLRSLEAVYLLARANGASHPDHTQLMKHIVQPNFYRSSQKSKQKVVQQYLSEVIPLVANNAMQGMHFPLRFARNAPLMASVRR